MEFVEDSKTEMEAKSKQLNFGRVGFRKSTSITISTKKMETIIKNLKKFGMDDCIITKESINKEVLVRYPEKDITKTGASLKIEDKFWLETNKEKIRG